MKKDGFKFYCLTYNQLNNNKLRDKLCELNHDPDLIINESLEAKKNGGDVFVAYFNNSIIGLYVFTLYKKADNITTLELSEEYYNESQSSSSLINIFDENVKEFLVYYSPYYSEITFKKLIINKGDYKNNNSLLSIIFGFTVGFIIYGVIMRSIVLGVLFGLLLSFLYYIVFANYKKNN